MGDGTVSITPVCAFKDNRVDEFRIMSGNDGNAFETMMTLMYRTKIMKNASVVPIFTWNSETDRTISDNTRGQNPVPLDAYEYSGIFEARKKLIARVMVSFGYLPYDYFAPDDAARDKALVDVEMSTLAVTLNLHGTVLDVANHFGHHSIAKNLQIWGARSAIERGSKSIPSGAKHLSDDDLKFINWMDFIAFEVTAKMVPSGFRVCDGTVGVAFDTGFISDDDDISCIVDASSQLSMIDATKRDVLHAFITCTVNNAMRKSGILPRDIAHPSVVSDFDLRFMISRGVLPIIGTDWHNINTATRCERRETPNTWIPTRSTCLGPLQLNQIVHFAGANTPLSGTLLDVAITHNHLALARVLSAFGAMTRARSNALHNLRHVVDQNLEAKKQACAATSGGSSVNT